MSEIRTKGQHPSFKETLGYFTADVNPHTRDYEARLYAGVLARAEELGYRINRFELGSKGLTMPQLGKLLISRGIRGLILAPWPHPHTETELDWQNIATVTIGYSLVKPEIHRVTRDVMHSLRNVYAQLNTAGYKRIGFVMERDHAERMDFMTLAAFQLNAFLTPKQNQLPALVENDLKEQTFHDWVITHKPDVIFTMHRPVLNWLKSAGHRVPEDIGLYVFNCESPDSGYSGIYPAYETIGATAVEQVAALVERGGFGIPENATTVIVPGIPCIG
ncbi:hypothetical protein P0Y35_16785 [Kiritimatiellaeota bacterium B1221]|nr:hypothetical protein [Kiritimatiellaeota bacterium B1221]